MRFISCIISLWCTLSCDMSLLRVYPSEQRINHYIDLVFPSECDTCIIDLRKALGFDFDTLYYFPGSAPMTAVNEVVKKECYPGDAFWKRCLGQGDRVGLATQDWEEMIVAIKNKTVHKYLFNAGYFSGPIEKREYFMRVTTITNPYCIVTRSKGLIRGKLRTYYLFEPVDSLIKHSSGLFDCPSDTGYRYYKID